MINLTQEQAAQAKDILGENWENKLMSLKSEYEEWADLCARGLRHVQTRIEDYQDEMRAGTGYNLIERFSIRIKTFDSVVEKCLRKGYGGLSLSVIKENVFDIAGVRIITKYSDDIYPLAKALRRDFRPMEGMLKDYISNPKDNGYRSLQFTIKERIDFYDRDKEPIEVPVEIQIRTTNMNSWSTIEHDLCYKKDMPVEICQAFRKYAEALATCDQQAEELKKLCVEYNKTHKSNNQ